MYMYIHKCTHQSGCEILESRKKLPIVALTTSQEFDITQHSSLCINGLNHYNVSMYILYICTCIMLSSLPSDGTKTLMFA